MNEDELERVAILRSDLEDIANALAMAYSHALALDLADGYRNLRENAKQSKLTNMLERTAQRAHGYLPQDEETPDLWVPGQ